MAGKIPQKSPKKQIFQHKDPIFFGRNSFSTVSTCSTNTATIFFLYLNIFIYFFTARDKAQKRRKKFTACAKWTVREKGSPWGELSPKVTERGFSYNLTVSPLSVSADGTALTPPPKGRLTTCNLTAYALKPISQTKRANTVRPYGGRAIFTHL